MAKMETRSKSKMKKLSQCLQQLPVNSGDIKDSMIVEYENHPLLNSVVLTSLFGYCSIKDIVNCRLVCREWYDASLKKWRSNVRLTVNVSESHGASEVKAFLGTPNLPSGYENSMFKLESCPYRRVRVVGVLSCEDEDGLNFWNTFGSSFTELFIDWPAIHWGSLLNTILFEKTPNIRKLIFDGITPHPSSMKDEEWVQYGMEKFIYSMPDEGDFGSQKNLKTLEIRECSWVSFPPFTWKTFMCSFSKLEDISVPASDQSESYDTRIDELKGHLQSMSTVFKAIQHVKELDSNNLCIKHINMIPWYFCKFDRFCVKIIDYTLRKLKLPLKTLKLNLGEDIHSEELQNAIDFYAETLETLTIHQFRPNITRYNIYELFNQTLSSLHTLEVVGVLLRDLHVVLKFVPNLKKLCIHSYHHSQYVRDTPFEMEQVILKRMEDYYENKFKSYRNLKKLADVRLLSLVEFHFPLFNNHSMVKCLRKVMPFLEVLKGRILVQAFPEICSQWGNTLREITLDYGSNMDDETIRGIDSKSASASTSIQKGNITMMKDLEIFRMEKYTRPWVRDLKPTDYPKITDNAINHGFMKLPRLHTLEIQTTAKVGENCLELLKTKGVDVSVNQISLTCRGRKI